MTENLDAADDGLPRRVYPHPAPFWRLRPAWNRLECLGFAALFILGGGILGWSLGQ